MKQLILITWMLVFNGFSSFACLNTYQFKMFPVGVHNDTILTVDVQIRRTSQAEGNRRLGLELEAPDVGSEMWILNAFVSKYDKHQRLFEKDSIGMTYSIGKDYLDSLQMIYSKGLAILNTQYPDSKRFKPTYLSFCDFQQSCEQITLLNDNTINKDYILYDGKKFPVNIIQDSSYYAFGNSVYHPRNILGLYVNSVRIYKAGDFELVIPHLATGHEISMGWITSDIEVFKAKELKKEPVSLSKEYKAETAFDDIREAVYEEPLLHHGYGFDVFIVNEK